MKHFTGWGDQPLENVNLDKIHCIGNSVIGTVFTITLFLRGTQQMHRKNHDGKILTGHADYVLKRRLRGIFEKRV